MNRSTHTEGLLFLLLSIAIGALAAIGALGFLALVKLVESGAWPGQGAIVERMAAALWWLRDARGLAEVVGVATISYGLKITFSDCEKSDVATDDIIKADPSGIY